MIGAFSCSLIGTVSEYTHISSREVRETFNGNAELNDCLKIFQKPESCYNGRRTIPSATDGHDLTELHVQ
jgi:hypothetical protein